jgi:hypothetical protein
MPGRKRRRTYIHVRRRAELRQWAHELEIDEESLREAVSEAGSRVSDVREYLVRKHFSNLHPSPRARRLTRRRT